MRQKFANNAESVLVKGVTADDTSLQVKDVSSFPVLPSSGQLNWRSPYFLATLSGKSPGGEENRWEIIRVLLRGAGGFTVQRGQEGTLARSWPAGTSISLRMTAETARRMLAIRPMIVGPWLIRVGVPAKYRISNYCSFLTYSARIGGKVFDNDGDTLTITPTADMFGNNAVSFACGWPADEVDFDAGVTFTVVVSS